MSNFPSELNRVLRYTMRTRDELLPFLPIYWKEHTEGGNPSWLHTDRSTPQTRGVLADFFGDNGDPREHILRKTWKSTDPYHQVGKPPIPHVRFSDGSRMWAIIVGDKVRQPNGRLKTVPKGVQLKWTLSKNEPSNGEKESWMSFDSTHTPEEAKSILSQFHPDDAPGIEELTKLIDKHFPQKG